MAKYGADDAKRNDNQHGKRPDIGLEYPGQNHVDEHQCKRQGHGNVAKSFTLIFGIAAELVISNAGSFIDLR